MAAILNKPRGLFHFHLATLLVGNAILSALILINVESTATYSAQIHQGWPFKFIRYDGSAPDSPFLDIVSKDALAANVLLWLTILLAAVGLVESRCRNGKVADVMHSVSQLHWTAWLGAVAAAIVSVCMNLNATEFPWYESKFYEYGWPFKFSIYPPSSENSGIRYLVLNAYFTAFMSMLTLLLVQCSIRGKKEHS